MCDIDRSRLIAWLDDELDARVPRGQIARRGLRGMRRSTRVIRELTARGCGVRAGFGSPAASEMAMGSRGRGRSPVLLRNGNPVDRHAEAQSIQRTGAAASRTRGLCRSRFHSGFAAHRRRPTRRGDCRRDGAGCRRHAPKLSFRRN
jgi:hypothetical protein